MEYSKKEKRGGKKIALIDNDLVVRKTHNFPNLALMKISAYHKSIGNDVKLIGFNEINPANLFNTKFDEIIISKAFTDSPTPEFITKLNNVKKGGTGFYFDLASNLPDEIEHSFPDYNLYNPILHTINKKEFYNNYSIGYTTRGCFRHCSFCVNRTLNKVDLHSPVNEFYDNTKPKIALLDDNILGLPNRELYKIFDRFKEIGKPIQYRQGMDIRLLTKERINKIFELRYDNNYYFAFDLWKYKNEIERALKMWSEAYQNKKAKSNDVKFIQTKIYTFTGLDENNNYDDSFWLNDIELLFKRIEIILRYKAVPYIMRYKTVDKSSYRGVYINLAQWANSPSQIIGKSSLIEFLEDDSFSTKKTLDFFKKNKRFHKYLNLKL